MNFFTRIKQSPNLRWFILANVALGTFMATLDSSIVNVALPTMSVKFNTSLITLQWVVTAYLLAISSLLPVFGRLADLLGRKRVYSMGFIFFSLGSALCGLAGNVWFLVAMRIVQAFGASMLMSNNQALIVANFPDNERGRALGISGTMVALGALTGPAIGGLLVGLVGWRSIFYINVPIGIIAFIAAQIIIPNDTVSKKTFDFDYLGAILFAFGMISLLYSINNGEDLGWQSAIILSGIFSGFILLALFVFVELRKPSPVIDLSIYKNKLFLIGNVSALIAFMGQFTNVILMPFYLQHVLNYSSTQVGLLMTTFPLAMAIVAPISGYISDKTGPFALTTGGLLVNACGLFYLTTVTAHSPFYLIIPGPLLMGTGAGMFSSPNNSSVMGAVSKDKLGVAGGLNALVRNVGMVIGTTLAVNLFESRQTSILKNIPKPSVSQTASAFLSSYHTVMLVGGVILLFAAFISFNRKTYVNVS